ncbi:MAG: DmsC/YnfH family molybdoenzyme membrane anchor subunit [Enterobacter hormaechei]|nr:DmsC/YnfH family molybdoenzyme membrane anchor subunit [Enterobacter hormaechei]
MGSGWHEWPLVIFTVFGQCVAGALIVMGFVWLKENDDKARMRIVRSLFCLWLVMGIGFMASVLHLGSPLRAFNSLNRVGASALSNEIAAGSIFFAVGGFWWLVSVIGKMPPAFVFVWAMTRVYQIETVPTWYTGYTTLSFFLTMVLAGPLLAALLLRVANVTFKSALAASVSALALIVCVAVVVLQSNTLGTIQSSIQQANALLPDYGSLQVWRIALLAAGLGCWICPLIRRQEPKTLGLFAGVVLVALGELIGRGLFYGLHMTAGLAIAG